MDNIKNNAIFHKIAKGLNVVLFVFPILVDLVSLVSLVFPSIEDNIRNHLSPTAFWCIFVSVNIVLIVGIFAAIELRYKEKIEIAIKFVYGYQELLKKHTSNLIRFEETAESFESVDELYVAVYGYLKSTVDSVSKILCDVTGENVRVCIKSFPEKYDHRDVSKMTLITFCRSNADSLESERERKERINVIENTDFKHILTDSYPYFAFNGLTNFKKVTKMEYQNSTKDWNTKYNATIVHPISRSISYQKSQERIEILGFLCADTLKTTAFSADYGKACQVFLSSIAYLLYIFLDKCILYREKIENQKTI